MKELTILYDYAYKEELKEYLLSLNGINDVKINESYALEISIKYNSSLITNKIIKLEIDAFLGLLKTPAIIGFDKHCNNKPLIYIVSRNNICCEYCLKGAIDELFEIEGIEKVKTNFYENNQKLDDIILNITYDPNILADSKMKKIDVELNI